MSDLSLSLPRSSSLAFYFLSPVQLRRGSDRVILVGSWHLSRPNQNTLLNAVQDNIHLLYCKGVLLARIQLDVHQNPQMLFCKAAFQSGGSQCILVPGVVPAQVQDFAFLLAELCDCPVNAFLQLVKVPLDGSMTFWSVNRSTWFVSSANLLRVHFPVIQVINEGVKQDR